MLIVRQVILFLFPSMSVMATIWRESLHWVCAIAVLLIVTRSEHLPLSSIGIGTSPLSRSLLWGLILAVVCAVVGFAIAIPTHFNGGKTGESLGKLPLWLTSLVVVRAGVVEELFYRGYAIERLQSIGLKKFVAAAIPLIVFALGHWRGGWANVVIALALGGVLSASYLWRRDLVANMIGHFLVDFVGVILPRLLHHS
jgi:membrane protease YdiL (CAAX protease family)